MTPKKCKVKGCYSDACCRDKTCAFHTEAGRGLANHGSRSYPKHYIPHLGVEIECIASHATAFKALTAQSKRPHYDGTLGSLGCEFKICKPANQAIKLIPKFGAQLTSLGAKVDKSCGLHVHLDARGISVLRIRDFLRWLGTWEIWWFECIPPSRRASDFCRPINSNGSNHYKWANATTYHTVEIRIHPGTLNPHKIKAWLCVCADLMNLLRSETELPVMTMGDSTRSWGNHVKLQKIFVRKEGLDYLLHRHACGGVLVTTTNSGQIMEGD